MERARGGVLTIVAKKELVFAGTEHAHGTTGLAPFSELLLARIIALRNSDALETIDTTSAIKTTVDCNLTMTDSERSMISKPFVHKMAILAFKKMMS